MMLKISKKRSVTLSLILAAVFMVLLVACAVLLPKIVPPLVTFANNSGAIPSLTAAKPLPILIFGYLIVASMALADVLLVSLLLHVKNDKVFSEGSVARIRGISWCCFAMGVCFAALGIWFQLSLLAAVAAVFLGLCLRVVKNVIEQATAIKEENDFTV